MAGVELASAYLSLVPSFKGGQAAIADELGAPIARESARAGKESGRRFGDAFSGAAQGVLGAAAVWGGGEVLARGFSQAVEQADLPGLLGTQFDLAGPLASEAAATAGRLYSQGWGASLTEVGNTAAAVTRALRTVGSSEDVDRVTRQAQALAEMFGQEVEPLIRAAQKAVSTGLAPDMEAAFDIIAKGFQNGANEADDLLDGLSEYSTQFRSLGLDAETALGLVTQGLRAGARDSDVVMDALKEFAIEAVAGADRVRTGYESLGVDADKMFAQLGQGGPAAAKALDFTLDRLRAIEDPVKRNAIAIELFGTKAEDLGAALYSLDPSTAVAALGEVEGAAQGVADALDDSTQQALAELSRAFDAAVAGAIAPLIPVLRDVLEAVEPWMPVLGPIAIGLTALTAATWLWNAGLGVVLKTGWTVLNFAGRLIGQLGALVGRTIAAAAAFAGRMVAALALAITSMVRYLATQAMVVARTVAGWVLMGAQALLQAARIAAAWLIALGPIGWVIAAVAAVVTLIIIYFDEIVAAISAAWDWVTSATSSAWAWITGIIGRAWGAIKGAFSAAWSAIMSGARSALDWVGAKWQAFAGLISGIVNRVRGFLGGIWDGLKNGARSAANFAIRIINGLISGANTAISGLNVLPGVNIGHIPHIPYLAQGGVTTGPTLAMIGEGREQEAVLPLSKLNALLDDRGGTAVVRLDVTGTDRHLVAWLKNVIRVQGGGNVQAALGRG